MMSKRIFPLSSGQTAWESSITQTWEVTEKLSASGRRRAISNQLYPNYTFEADFGTLTDAEVATLLGFYATCKGSLLPFWYKDFDARVEMQEIPKNTAGAYQCFIKTGNYVEACYKVDNLRVYVDSVETLEFSEANGLITLKEGIEAKHNVCATYEYYRYVKFADDLSITQLAPNINSASLKLQTVR